MMRYLEQDVRGVMKQHNQGANANVVGAVRETEQEDGCQMVDHLFFKILVKTNICRVSSKGNTSVVCQQKNLSSCSYCYLLIMR